MSFPESGLSHDAFLCGRLHLWQPLKGYRAATTVVEVKQRLATDGQRRTAGPFKTDGATFDLVSIVCQRIDRPPLAVTRGAHV